MHIQDDLPEQRSVLQPLVEDVITMPLSLRPVEILWKNLDWLPVQIGMEKKCVRVSAALHEDHLLAVDIR